MLSSFSAHRKASARNYNRHVGMRPIGEGIELSSTERELCSLEIIKSEERRQSAHVIPPSYHLA